MERKTFNPQDWLNQPTQQPKVTEQQNFSTDTQSEEVERIIQSIEANRTDITSTYSDWVNIGFAFADEFGENGRNLFHRVSQFYPDYSAQECDKQFDNCLKSKGHGVSLKTFFYLAKDAGIEIAPPRAERQDHRTIKSEKLTSSQVHLQQRENREPEQMPTFPDSLFPELPEFLQKVVAVATSKEERDILLLGSLGAISACLPKVSGIYDGKRVFPNLCQTDNGLDDYFEALGNEFYGLYKVIMQDEPRQFYLTADQQEQFNQFFGQIQEKYMNLQGLDYMATIRRLGLIAYRICMICSALRIMETGDTSKKLICEERDFQTSLSMVKVLVKHSSKVFVELPQEGPKPTRMNKKEKFLYALPHTFNRQKYLEVAKAMSIPAMTAEGYIANFVKSVLIHREAHDQYINTSLEESQDSKETKDE